MNGAVTTVPRIGMAACSPMMVLDSPARSSSTENSERRPEGQPRRRQTGQDGGERAPPRLRGERCGDGPDTFAYRLMN